MAKEPASIGGILKLISRTPAKQIYVIVYNNIYNGDDEGGIKIKVTTEKERAKSIYLNKAYEYEKYFLNAYEEHALINRDDQSMYCECYTETEKYCQTHAIVYVKTFDI